MYSQQYSTETVTLSSDEMVAEASLKMNESLNHRLLNSTLIRINTMGEFSDSAYNMKSNFVCLEKIGTDMPFEAVK